MRYHWGHVNHLVERIMEQIHKDTANPPITAIATIGRGGMVPTAMLSHQLGIPLVHFVGYSRRFGHWGTTLFDEDWIAKDDRLLFVDDVVESGGSINAMNELYSGMFRYPIRFAVLSVSEHCKLPIDYKGEIWFDREECPTMPWEKPDGNT